MIERRTLLTGLAAVSASTLLGCSRDEPSPAPSVSPRSGTPLPTAPGTIRPQVAGTIATGLNVPWGIAFLADGSALVSQRDAGSIVRITPDGQVSDLGEVLGSQRNGEGGLMGIALDPDDESVLYVFHSTNSDDRLVRLSLDGGRVGRPEPLITGVPSAVNHHGGRLLFDKDGNLFVALGDAAQPELAQDRTRLSGSILRLDKEGRPAVGNPFDNEIWSYGHRNIEGLAFDAGGRLWASEFGQDAFDELNLIEKGKNYGWPRFEGESAAAGFVTPKVTWGTDECSPAGLAITRSTAFVAALKGQRLWMVPLDGDAAGKPTALFTEKYGRIRNVVVAPDESLWITTSNTDGRNRPGKGDDRILRVML